MNSVVGKQIHIILKLKTQTENSSLNLRDKEVLEDLPNPKYQKISANI